MGIQTFGSVVEAIDNGFEVYEHCPAEGYIKVRKQTDSTHWALALVVLDAKTHSG